MNQNVIRHGLFHTPSLASVACDDYPGERLLVCFDPLVAAERWHKPNALLDLAEANARPLASGYAVGRYDCDEFNRRFAGLRRRGMGKHFA